MNELSFPSDRMRSPSSQNSVARRTGGTWGAEDFTPSPIGLTSFYIHVVLVSKLFIFSSKSVCIDLRLILYAVR